MPLNDWTNDFDVGFEVEPRSRSEILDYVQVIHDAVKYDGRDHFRIIEYLEIAHPLVDSNFVLEIGSIKELGGDFGQTSYGESRIILREDIYENALRGDGLARLTAAHELGLLILHTDSKLMLNKRSSAKGLEAYRSSEWQANAFAGALLMPTLHIVNLEAEEISEKYKVTKTAAKTQKKAICEGLVNYGVIEYL